jgi:hypothetical protein
MRDYENCTNLSETMNNLLEQVSNALKEADEKLSKNDQTRAYVKLDIVSRHVKNDVADAIAANPGLEVQLIERVEFHERCTITKTYDLLPFMSRKEFVSTYLEYNGIIGFTDTIMNLCDHTI